MYYFLVAILMDFDRFLTRICSTSFYTNIGISYIDKTRITETLALINICSIEYKIIITTQSIIYTTKWIWTIYTARITITLKFLSLAFKGKTINAFTILIIRTRIGFTRVHSKVKYSDRDSSNCSFRSDFEK